MAEGLNAGSVYYTVEADTSKLLEGSRSADSSLDSLNKQFGKTDKSAKDAQFQMTKTATAVRGLGREAGAASEFAKGLGRVLGGLISLKTASLLIKMADDYNEMAERIRMATKSTSEFNAVQDRLLQTANGTYRALSEAQEVYIQTADSLRSLGYSTDEVLDITDSLSYSFVKNATDSDKAKTAMDAFTKSINKGKVDSEGWQTIMAAVPTVVEDIATATGKTTSQIRELGYSGKLTATMLTEGLRKSLDDNKKAADDMATTVSDAFVAVRNSISVFVGKANQASGVTDGLAQSIVRVAEAIQQIDLQTVVREIDSIKATITLLVEGVEGLLDMVDVDIADMTGNVGKSFSQMALDTAKEVDGIAKVFQGTVGAIESIWKALANNIPVFFTNAWNEVKRDAAGFVNSLADMVNVPLQALGREGIGKVNFGVKDPKELINLADAARSGWESAAKGVGAYEKTLNRITDNVLWGSIADWEADYTGETKKATESTKKLADATDKLSGKSKKLNKDVEANQKVIQSLKEQLMLAALSGEKLAVVKESLKLNPAATPEEVAEVERLAAALYKVEQMKALQKKVGDDPSKYVQGDVSPLSGGAFDDQAARYEAEAVAEQERYAAQLVRLQEAMEAQKYTLEEYYAEFEGLTQTHADRMAQIDQAKTSVMLMSASNGFGALAEMLKQSQGEQSKAYKAMFAVSKAFSVANASLALFTAISEAWKLPWPANIPAIAAAATAMGTVISSVSSVSMGGGRQYGGPVDANSMHRINEGGKPEVLNMANGKQFLLPNGRGEVVSNRDATSGGGNAPNVTVVINNAPEGTRVEQRQISDAEFIVDVMIADVATEGRFTQAGSGALGWRRTGQ